MIIKSCTHTCSARHGKVARIAGDETTPLGSGERELLAIGELHFSNFVGADRIDVPSTKPLSDSRGEILVEIELHARRVARRLGGVASGTASAFSAITKKKATYLKNT